MKAREVAYAFINLFKDEDEGITNLKLQKLLYYAQGCSYQRLGRELFEDEIEAWDNGPVVHDVYKRYQSCGRSPIRVCEDIQLSSEEERLILDVAREYGQYTTSKLVGMTHHRGTPWDEVYVYGKKRNIIPKSLIKEYFTEKEPRLESFDIMEALDGVDVVDLISGGEISSEEWVYE